MDKLTATAINWKPIIGYETHYEISNTGLIRTISREYLNTGSGGICKVVSSILKPFLGRKYPQITLRINSSKKMFNIHRLVAIAFIENPNEYKCINHKDGNKHNNHVSNLEWVNHSQNAYHAYRTGLKMPPSERIVVDLYSGITYQSISHFARSKNINKGNAKAKLKIGEYKGHLAI